MPNRVSANISLFPLIGKKITQHSARKRSQWQISVTKRWMYVLCERECNFIPSDKLWQECLVWHCGNIHPVCLGLLPLCVCVNVCVQVETQASKHRLFSHSCVEQQFRGVCVRVCVRVCAWMGVLRRVSSPRPEARLRLQKTRSSVSVCHDRRVWLTSRPSTRAAWAFLWSIL